MHDKNDVYEEFPHGRAEPIPDTSFMLGLIPLIIKILFKYIYLTKSFVLFRTCVGGQRATVS